MSILLFFLVLFILVLVHEWGHFIVAKKTGMRVDEFGIGFPPKAAGFRRRGDETEYTLNWLPIGGFVKIWGENYEQEFSPVESEASDRRSEDGRVNQSGGLIDGEGGKEDVDYSRAFSNRPKWAQALVLIAGVTMNVLFAWLLFSITYMVGVATPVEESVATDAAELYVTATLPDSPAAALPPGAVVTEVAYGDVVIERPLGSEFSDAVLAAAPAPVTVQYEYRNTLETVELAPVQGLDTTDPERYTIGVALAMVETQSEPFFTALADGAVATWRGLESIMVGLWNLLSQAFVGDADFSQVAGPVGIVGMVGDAASFGLTALLTFTAIISLNLAVINLLPFPALDGGRLVFVAIETVTGKHIPPEWAGRVNLVGFALLMLLMIVVTYNDILRLL